MKPSILCGLSMEEGGEVFVQGIFIIARERDLPPPDGYHFRKVYLVERYQPQHLPGSSESVWLPIDMGSDEIFVVCEDGETIPINLAPWDYGMCGEVSLIGLQDFNPYAVRKKKDRMKQFIREELGYLS